MPLYSKASSLCISWRPTGFEKGLVKIYIFSILQCASTTTLMPHGERTFIMVKPDGVQRGLVGDIIKRFEFKGFKLVGTKMMQVSKIRS